MAKIVVGRGVPDPLWQGEADQGKPGVFGHRPSLAASTTATAVSRQRVFSATSVAWCFHHVAATVTGLIRLEMIECLRTA